MKHALLLIVMISFVIVIFCCAACFHDLRVMKEYNYRLQEQLGQIVMEQEAQQKELRVIKTNNDLVLDLVINKEWEIE